MNARSGSGGLGWLLFPHGAGINLCRRRKAHAQRADLDAGGGVARNREHAPVHEPNAWHLVLLPAAVAVDLPICSGRWVLLVSQRVNGVEFRGLPRRVKAGDDADDRAGERGNADPKHGRKCGPLRERGDDM